MRMSQSRASSNPPAIHGPSMAAINGFSMGMVDMLASRLASTMEATEGVAAAPL